MMSKKIRVPEYAKAMGQTYQNVVAKLNRGTLKGGKDKEGRFVLVDSTWDSTIEPEQGGIGQEGVKGSVDTKESTFSEHSTGIELHGTIQTLSESLKGQQHLAHDLQSQIRELNQGITDDKKRGEKTYLKMIAIMAIGFLVMGGLIAFIFAWGERSMIKNVDAHRATFESQKAEFLQAIQKRELEFSVMLDRVEANHAKEVKAIERINEIQAQAMMKLEGQLTDALAKLESERQKYRLLLANVSELKGISASGNLSSNREIETSTQK